MVRERCVMVMVMDRWVRDRARCVFPKFVYIRIRTDRLRFWLERPGSVYQTLLH